jgi:cyclopropane fatty-acyl-phospholipid synthase-like methyltransferase
MYQELLIGCGSELTKRMTCDGVYEWHNVTTLDYNADHKPDVVWDLMHPDVLPFEPNTFDEIHAYEVLEHLGQQGDYKLFFKQFTRFWEVLKPGGHFFATCPSRHSVWALGDPSHSRIMQKEQLVFLRQSSYDAVGKTSISDFRSIYKADFQIMLAEENEEQFVFILKAIK